MCKKRVNSNSVSCTSCWKWVFEMHTSSMDYKINYGFCYYQIVTDSSLWSSSVNLMHGHHDSVLTYNMVAVIVIVSATAMASFINHDYKQFSFLLTTFINYHHQFTCNRFPSIITMNRIFGVF